MDKTIVIKPLNSALKVNKFIKIISLCFSVAIILGYFTDCNIYLLSIELLIFLGTFIYQCIKTHRLKNSVYIMENDNILINNVLYPIKELSYSTDKHENLIITHNQKNIVKINKLSYNVEHLKEAISNNIKSQ